jgi:hypothetical protein
LTGVRTPPTVLYMDNNFAINSRVASQEDGSVNADCFCEPGYECLTCARRRTALRRKGVAGA